MKTAPIPANEAERLRELERYRILDTAPESAFDDLTRLASRVCDCRGAVVNFVDANRVWTKAGADWLPSELPREHSFSAFAILEHQVFIVEDTHKDERFADSPLVTAPSGPRFFAGAPLITPSGLALGTLSVIDTVPRKLTKEQIEALQILSRQVVSQLELRLHLVELEREVRDHRHTEAALREAEIKYRGIFENVVEGIFQTTPDGHYIAANPMLAHIYGFDTAAELVASFTDVSRQLYVDSTRRDEFVHLLEKNDVISEFESQVYRRDGSIIWISENARAVRDSQGKLLYYEGTVEDITERKRIKETLVFSEKRFRSIWENSGDGMRLTDKDGIIRAVNPAYCRIVDMTPEELEGKPYTVIFAPETGGIDRRMEKYKQRFAARSIESRFERGVTIRNGRTVQVALSNSFVEMDGREPLLLSIFHDITQRKQMEQALRDSEVLYHSLVANLPQNIFRKDLNERFTFANQRFCDTLGRPREEIIGKTDFDFFPPELAAKYQRDDQRIIETHLPQETIEGHQKATGENIYVQVIKSPLLDGSGRVIGIQGIFWDVTERKRIEEQLAFERDLLRSLLDNVPDRIYFKDLQSRFIRCTTALARRLGVSDPDAVIGKTDFDFHPADRAREYFDDEQRVISTGQPMINKIECQVATDGSEIWASVTKVPIRSKSGTITGLIGISRDITQLKHTEQELAEARDAALESARLKAQFLATMSHEIRTPMNGIIGMIGLLLDTNLQPEQRDFAQTVRASAEALLDIINDILDFSKIEAGKLTFEQIDFDVRDVIESAVELLAQRGQSKGLELFSLAPSDVPTHLRGDPGRIRQILVNLIGNAVKFTETGEIAVRVEKLDETGNRVRLKFKIIDTGIGIAPDVQAKIFQPFIQADGSTTRKYGGTGLGLAICRQLVELMGGEIGVESDGGQGSTFWFTLPLDKQQLPSTPPSDQEQTLASVRALIVDDNATNREILRHQLESWHMVAHSATDGPSALEALRAAQEAGQPFQLMLLDSDLPGVTGLTFAHQVSQNPPTSAVKVILLTSLGERLDESTMNAAGISACLLKPVKQSRLHDCLISVISNPSQSRPGTSGGGIGDPAARTNGGSRKPGLRILLAEDNSVNQKVALLQLRKLGFGADTASNGKEAVDARRQIAYDVILMDCQMPVMDGYEAAQQIRIDEQASAGDHPARPTYIIAMTANVLEGDREQCRAAGMDDYITKPVQVHELQAALARAQVHSHDHQPVPAPVAPTPPAESPRDSDALDWKLIQSLRDLREEGQPDPLAELIDLFLQDAPRRLEKLREAIAAGDSLGTYAASHSLKGSASNMGARALAASCAIVEKQARSGKLEGADQLLRSIETELRQTSLLLEGEKTK